MLLRQAGPESVTDGPERALGFLAPFYTSAERSALRLTRTGQGPPPNPLPPTLRLTEANRTGAPRHAPAKELQWPGGWQIHVVPTRRAHAGRQTGRRRRRRRDNRDDIFFILSFPFPLPFQFLLSPFPHPSIIAVSLHRRTN